MTKRTRSIDEQLDALRPAVAIGFAAHLHRWFQAGAVVGVVAAVVFWHPVPLMIAAFLGVIGLAERWAGPNIVAAIAAYDSGRPTLGEVSIAVTPGDSVDRCQATVREPGRLDWEYEFVPQGWRPSTGTLAARIWRDEATGRPVLAVVEDGILIPRDDPRQLPGIAGPEGGAR
jgi:hypothetical protein